MTLDETSPLAQASDLCFGKVSRAEVSGIGFQLVTLTLLLIGTRLGEMRGTLTPARAEALRGTLRASTGDMRRTLGASLDPVRRLAERFADAGHVLFLGCGPSYGTAVNGSARVLEAVGWNASAQDTEEWAHLDRRRRSRLALAAHHAAGAEPDSRDGDRASDGALTQAERRGRRRGT